MALVWLVQGLPQGRVEDDQPVTLWQAVDREDHGGHGALHLVHAVADRPALARLGCFQVLKHVGAVSARAGRGAVAALGAQSARSWQNTYAVQCAWST